MPLSASTGGERERSRPFAERPPDVRKAPPWHRYAYHIRELPARLRELSGELRVAPGGRVLDFGCADSPYRRFFAPAVDFVGADLPGNPHAEIELNPDGSLPVDDGCFDALLSTQVLEHVAVSTNGHGNLEQAIAPVSTPPA